MAARLIVEAGTASPPICELHPHQSVQLGRNRNSNVVLRDQHASRLHAKIFHRDSRWYLRDCSTTNGTRLNGQRIRDTVALETGAQIGIGEICLRFTLESADVTPRDGTPLCEEASDDPLIAHDQSSTTLQPDELSAMVQFLNDSLKETSLRGLLTLALTVMYRQTGATLCGFLNFDSNDPLPRVVVPAKAPVDAQMSKQLTAMTLQANRPIWLATTPSQEVESDSLAAFSDAICIPLRVPSPGARKVPPLGALHAYKTNQAFTERQFRFCEVLAGSLISTLHVLRSRRVLEADNSRLRFRAPNEGDKLLGASPVMQQLHNQITQLADGPLTMLILGETGVGKELVALELHRQSSRGDGPLVPVNCAAIVRSIPESELFGHEIGAFTGAVRARLGSFQKADGGTLFLDEIGDLSMDCQGMLLRALETRSFCTVGGDVPVTVDVRILAATHRDLDKEVREGRFRADLLFRLGMSIQVPALRQHLDDIPILVEHFLIKLNEIYHRQARLTEEAMARLMTYSWPGNVRQLRSVLETALAMNKTDLIQAGELRLGSVSHPSEQAPGLNLKELETWAIRGALAQAGGNKTQAALLLGIHRDTLNSKCKTLEDPL